MSSFDAVKSILEVHHGCDMNRIVYEVSKVVDMKCDLLNARIMDLMHEQNNLSSEFKKARRFVMGRFCESANMTPMQKAFVDVVETVK